MKILLENAMIVTMDANRSILNQGYLLFNHDEIIDLHEGPYLGDRNDIQIIDGKNRIIIPGLINAHTHSYANLVKGTTENIPLEMWMLYVMAEGKNMSRDDYAISSALGTIEMLKSGTTTFLDHLAQDVSGLTAVADQYMKIGVRAIITPMFGDRPYSLSLPEEIKLGIGSQAHAPSSKASGSWRELIDMAEEVVKTLLKPEKGIGVAIGPSGPQRSSDDLLIASMELAQKYDLPWHTHLLETKSQEVTAHRLYGKSMVDHLHQLELLNSRISFAHGVWISKKDIELIENAGASVVHNPTSNLFLGSGILPVIALKEAGVNVALGTDGTNCSGYLSMFESMKLASILSNTSTQDYTKWLSADDVLEMATMGSAQAIRMSHSVGSLEIGKKPDFVVLNKHSTNFAPLNNLVWQIVYGRADMAIDEVFVGGRKVVENGKVTSVDETAVYQEATERGAFLLAKCQEDYSKINKEFPKFYEMLMRVSHLPTNKA